MDDCRARPFRLTWSERARRTMTQRMEPLLICFDYQTVCAPRQEKNTFAPILGIASWLSTSRRTSFAPHDNAANDGQFHVRCPDKRTPQPADRRGIEAHEMPDRRTVRANFFTRMPGIRRSRSHRSRAEQIRRELKPSQYLARLKTGRTCDRSVEARATPPRIVELNWNYLFARIESCCAAQSGASQN